MDTVCKTGDSSHPSQDRKNGLIDDYGYIYNADNDEDDDENDVNYTIEFDYVESN